MAHRKKRERRRDGDRKWSTMQFNEIPEDRENHQMAIALPIMMPVQGSKEDNERLSGEVLEAVQKAIARFPGAEILPTGIESARVLQNGVQMHLHIHRLATASKAASN